MSQGHVIPKQERKVKG